MSDGSSSLGSQGTTLAPSSHHVTPPYHDLIFDEDGPVVRLTLHRPKARNALSMRLSDELIHALERIRDSATTKLVIIRGAGGTFCAGDDITEMPLWGTAEAVMRRVHGYQHMANVLEELDKVTVAVVEGYAVGGGLEITLACDFVIAADTARWGMPEVDVGITPGWGGTTRLARLIGRRMTKEVNLLGALYPAARAAHLGLWNRVVPLGSLDDEIGQLVEVLLSKNHQAVRQLKFIINHGVEADLHTAQAFEALSAGLTGAVSGGWQVQDADAGAGVIAFAAKSELWNQRRSLAKDFWTNGPNPQPTTEQST
jgi:enoyl-CoA hydratase